MDVFTASPATGPTPPSPGMHAVAVASAVAVAVASAVGEHVAVALVQRGLHLHQAQHRREQVVVVGVRRRTLAHALQVQSTAAGEARREPHRHRHAGRLGRGDGVGHAMQEQALLAQRLAVVGQVDHRRVVVLQALQRADRLAQEVIGVQHGIVVAVGDLFARATADVTGIAGRGEAAECRRIALEVGRSMVAQLVQHHHPVTGFGAHLGGQVLQQDLIHAAAIGAQPRRGRPDWLSRHRGAIPARFSTCSSDWWARLFFTS
ncbi:hypothetical protein G6F57_018127 [Rhizopus arrhizus]|nr:hypothetical protein G6F57_018127 [Rhizopus arrhizus]